MTRPLGWLGTRGFHVTEPQPRLGLRPLTRRMADDVFEHPRLVAIYDALDPDRSDLEAYAAIAEELGAARVLDVGCGTGTFALLVADRGLEVTGSAILVKRSLRGGFQQQFDQDHRSSGTCGHVMHGGCSPTGAFPARASSVTVGCIDTSGRGDGEDGGP